MTPRRALSIAVPVTAALTLWAATAMSVTPSQPQPSTPPAQPTGGGSSAQVATLDQRRISALEDQVKALQAETNALKARMSTAENNIRPLQTHTHTYEIENVGGMNLATIQAHPNQVLIATKPNSQQGNWTTKTSSGPKN